MNQLPNELLENIFVNINSNNHNEPFGGYVRLYVMLVNSTWLKISRKVFFPFLAMRYACLKNNISVVKELLEDSRLFKDKLCNVTYLNDACKLGHYEIVEEMIKHPLFDYTFYNYEPFRLAAICGHMKIVKMFMKDKNVDPSICSNMILNHAAENGNCFIVREMLKDSRVTATVNDSALQLACSGCHIQIVKELLKTDQPYDFIIAIDVTGCKYFDCHTKARKLIVKMLEKAMNNITSKNKEINRKQEKQRRRQEREKIRRGEEN